METAIAQAPPRSQPGRGWVYRFFRKWRMRRIIALSHKLRITKYELSTTKDQLAANDREIDRLTKLAERWRRKCEVQGDEFFDRVLEMNKSIGTRFSVHHLEEDIQVLSEQPFADKQRKKIEEEGIETTLEGDELDLYNERYANHVQFAHSNGVYDEAAIKRLWDQHKDDEIGEIRASMQ